MSKRVLPFVQSQTLHQRLIPSKPVAKRKDLVCSHSETHARNLPFSILGWFGFLRIGNVLGMTLGGRLREVSWETKRTPGLGWELGVGVWTFLGIRLKTFSSLEA